MADLAPGGNGGSDRRDDRDREDRPDQGKRRKVHQRHSVNIIQRLEAVFKDNPHPDENERQELGRELGLEPRQIKYWFQNKRTHTKVHNEKAGNSVLRAENQHYHLVNTAIEETLKNVLCRTCEGLGIGVDARQQNLLRLRDENEQLRREHNRLASIMSNFSNRRNGPGLDQYSLPPRRSSVDFGEGILRGGRLSGELPKDTLYGIDLDTLGTSSINPLSSSSAQNQTPQMLEMEKYSAMVDAAISAMDELVELLRVDEPLWVKPPSSDHHHGSSMIHTESYIRLYPKMTRFDSPEAWIESSKESGIVSVSATRLFDIFRDPEKWMDFFPTMVTEARTVRVVDTGNRGGSLQLMYEKLHVLSPLVAPREFILLRYMKQLNPTTWVMTQVSYDSIKEVDASSSQAWMLPSGCVIQDTSNGRSKVTWIEHVEVDDKSLTHQMYKDIVRESKAYGAKCWLVALERMCERLAFSIGGSRPSSVHDLDKVFGTTTEIRRSMTKLTHRMMKNFYGMLSMQEKSNFSSHGANFRVSFRHSDFGLSGSGSGRTAMILCVATSITFPHSFENLFLFLKDEKIRHQWDLLANGDPITEMARISTGSHPGNAIAVLHPFVTKENTSMLILEESSIDTLEASLIYAPIEFSSVTSVLSGHDSTQIPVLPSGIIISSPDRCGGINIGGAAASSSRGGGTGGGKSSSLLTVALQILVTANTSSDDDPERPNLELVDKAHALLNSTIDKIRTVIRLNISQLREHR